MDLFDCSIVEGMDSIIRAIMERDAFHDRNVAILEAYRRSIYHLYQDHVRLVKLSIVRDAARRADKKRKKEGRRCDRNQIIYKRTSATAVLGSVSMRPWTIASNI